MSKNVLNSCYGRSDYPSDLILLISNLTLPLYTPVYPIPYLCACSALACINFSYCSALCAATFVKYCLGCFSRFGCGYFFFFFTLTLLPFPLLLVPLRDLYFPSSTALQAGLVNVLTLTNRPLFTLFRGEVR
ncbi:hypothetical protein B484DRAFT_57077 [Ochromonadaceae sp. CCMP2298]|nr:hypothetical protein B484DRAFT_57077 [Ochromonadaceae sp. CCMP2298]